QLDFGNLLVACGDAPGEHQAARTGLNLSEREAASGVCLKRREEQHACTDPEAAVVSGTDGGRVTACGEQGSGRRARNSDLGGAGVRPADVALEAPDDNTGPPAIAEEKTCALAIIIERG